jgi:hypothetical protein
MVRRSSENFSNTGLCLAGRVISSILSVTLEKALPTVEGNGPNLGMPRSRSKLTGGLR